MTNDYIVNVIIKIVEFRNYDHNNEHGKDCKLIEKQQQASIP